jgi:hypothetical protein
MFVSAFLIFWIEPLLGKLLLPVFGGTPATWTICLLFFQAALLAGYLYAHGLARRAPFLAGAVLHLSALGLVSWLFPGTVRAALGAAPPVGAEVPAWSILKALTLCAGLPFVVVSATSSLLQDWFAGSGLPEAANPYPLYAASNAGSVAALVAYPWVIESSLSADEQWKRWRALYALMVLAISACAAWRFRRSALAPRRVALRATTAPASVPAVDGRRILRWVAGAFAASSLLMGVTSYLSTDILAMPLLWVVPLAIYLAVFGALFARPLPPAGRAMRLVYRAFCLGALFCVAGIALELGRPAWFFLPLHLLVFAAACVVCLGGVASDRPATGDLTRYYLWISVGGVLGGVFNGLVAPALFNGITEYPLAMLLACVVGAPGGARLPRRSDAVAMVGCAALVGAGALVARGLHADVSAGYLAVLPALLLCYGQARSPLRYALCLAALAATANAWLAHPAGELLYRERSFYGTVKVIAKPELQLRFLVNGSTSHGAQSTDPARRREPLTYYLRTGPIGQIFGELRRAHAGGAGIAVIGLGTGTLVTYAEAGDQWTFYELDPGVVRVARDPRFFTYLLDKPPAAALSVVVGDARLRIRQARDASLDLLVVDAFSSDAVPAHLMTREALTLYLSKLAPGGLIAFHLSSRFLHLAPVVAAVASAQGLVARVRADSRPESDRESAAMASIWAVVARSEADLGPLARDERWQSLAADPRWAWTDDFSHLAGLLSWRAL